MVTQKQFKDYYMNLYNSGAIYVWGANGEKITKELMNKLYKDFGSSKYTKSYYDNKYKEGAGKIGADCSGSIYPLSKTDDTARGYYNSCVKKGKITDLPKDTACLIFNSTFTHVGAYLGNGITIEMRSSLLNCVKQNFQQSRWAYYGIPSWLSTSKDSSASSSNTSSTTVNKKKAVIKNIQKWCNNYCKAGIEVDGVYGSETKKALCKSLQHYLNISKKAGLKEDGKFGESTKKACTTATGKTPLVYICQAMLFCKGYDMSHSISSDNKLDGVMGNGTIKVIWAYQQDTRGLTHNGKCGASTFYAMFNR